MITKNNKKMLNKAVSLAIVLAMALAFMLPLTSVVSHAAAPSSYTNISAGDSIWRSSSSGTVYYRFVPTYTGSYTFYSSGNSGDPQASLLDASGSYLTSNDDGAGSRNFSITYNCTAGTAYYIAAYTYSGSASYYVNVRMNFSACDEHTYSGDCDTSCDNCGSTREASGTHIYGGNCDTDCNVCGSTRTVTHIFDNDCDDTCNGCDYTRSISHNYVDEYCTVCGQPVPPYAARHGSNSSGDVFLGGKYMEIGISRHGSFGTSTGPASSLGFHRSGALGMIVDGDGWDFGNAPTTGDFFLPGTPEERYILSYVYNDYTYEYAVADRNSAFTGSWNTMPTVTDQSYDNVLMAVVEGETVHGIGLKITYSFGVNDKNYRTAVEITNNSGADISNVRFVRSFDPDQDVETLGGHETYNKVLANPDRTQPASDTNYAMVVARGHRSFDGFFFVAFDTRAYASMNVDFSPSSAYLDGLWNETHSYPNYATEESIAMSSSSINGYTKVDNAIALTFNLDTITSAGSTNFEFYSSMSPNVESDLEVIVRPAMPVINAANGIQASHPELEIGPSVDATVAAGHTLSYQWYINTELSNEGGTLIEGATDALYVLPERLAAGTIEYYYCVITSTKDDTGLFVEVVSEPMVVEYVDDEHVYSDWIVDLEATTTSAGLKHRECVHCGETSETEVIPAVSKIVVGSIEAVSGKTVKVTIDIINNPGILNAILTVNFDFSLTLIGVETHGTWKTLDFTAPETLGSPCTLTWTGSGEPVYASGALVTLIFALPAGASIGTDYDIRVSYGADGLVGVDGTGVAPEIEIGAVTIIDPHGDVNDDGVIDVVDVITLRRYLAGGFEITINESNSDVNGDGSITEDDVTALREMIVG